MLEIALLRHPEPTPAPTNRSDFSTSGWTITTGGETWTMQEPYGAFTWYPVNDQPSDKALYDISVTVPSPWVGIANGELADQTERRRADHDRVAPRRAGVVVPRHGRHRRLHAHHQHLPERHGDLLLGARATGPGWRRAGAGGGAALDWLEGLLGPYPFDSLGFVLVDSRSGMETQTMITLGTTDYTTSPAVLVHEMAHQWYGDQVTPDDWRDVWMNEGMAMYLQGAGRRTRAPGSA